MGLATIEVGYEDGRGSLAEKAHHAEDRANLERPRCRREPGGGCKRVSPWSWQRNEGSETGTLQVEECNLSAHGLSQESPPAALDKCDANLLHITGR